jgi:Rel homology dimerisation domain
MVKFFESDSTGREIWSADGIFTEADVHHQYAIALRTPEYTGKNRNQDVTVSIILVRRNDQKTSKPINFTYKSSHMRKRARPEDFETSDNIPVTIAENVASTSTGLVVNPSLDMTWTDSDVASVLENWLENLPSDNVNEIMNMDAVTNDREKSGRVPYLTKISAELKVINGKNMKKTLKKIEQIFIDSHNSGEK